MFNLLGIPGEVFKRESVDLLVVDLVGDPVNVLGLLHQILPFHSRGYDVHRQKVMFQLPVYTAEILILLLLLISTNKASL